ncbi:MAG: DUF357 domain-containing protein [Candidatus Poseidoniaceae archaeon]|jgi:hypothetical protein|tara:strand:- start:439 stop:738 length:300 start_codon:yes stop_codon:yes gene_type:complete
MTEELEHVSVERVEKYLDITRRARAKATPIHPEGSNEANQLAVMIRMADDYASDAQHFLNIGDRVRAFGAINYAHAWIDAGVKLGLLDGHGDDVLFTLP